MPPALPAVLRRRRHRLVGLPDSEVLQNPPQPPCHRRGPVRDTKLVRRLENSLASLLDRAEPLGIEHMHREIEQVDDELFAFDYARMILLGQGRDGGSHVQVEHGLKGHVFVVE